MKTHLILKSFSHLSIEEIEGGNSNPQPSQYPDRGSPTVGSERPGGQAWQGDGLTSEEGILGGNEAPSILSGSHTEN